MEPKKRIVIYHAHCPDGFAAAWAAWHQFGDVNTEYLAASYGDPPPDVTGRKVLIVDFSYPRPDLEHMASMATELQVLDHHKTAQQALDGFQYAVFDMNRSGAGITWDQLMAEQVKSGSVWLPRPWLIDYVEDRDLWRWKLPNSERVNAWLGTLRYDFSIWEAVAMNPLTDQIVAMGGAVLEANERYVEGKVKEARMIEWAGHKVPIVNTTHCASELLGRLAETAPFAIGWFQRQDGKFAFSLRSRGPEAVDVSNIAKILGGGGHRNAAGFTVGQWDAYLDALIRV
jgi:uncharacterized protein